MTKRGKISHCSGVGLYVYAVFSVIGSSCESFSWRFFWAFIHLPFFHSDIIETRNLYSFFLRSMHLHTLRHTPALTGLITHIGDCFYSFKLKRFRYLPTFLLKMTWRVLNLMWREVHRFACPLDYWLEKYLYTIVLHLGFISFGRWVGWAGMFCRLQVEKSTLESQWVYLALWLTWIALWLAWQN